MWEKVFFSNIGKLHLIPVSPKKYPFCLFVTKDFPIELFFHQVDPTHCSEN